MMIGSSGGCRKDSHGGGGRVAVGQPKYVSREFKWGLRGGGGGEGSFEN